MKITYIGPSPAVDIAIEGGAIRATNGEPVEVPDDLGRSLLEQDTFTAAKHAAKTPAEPATTEGSD